MKLFLAPLPANGWIFDTWVELACETPGVPAPGYVVAVGLEVVQERGDHLSGEVLPVQR
jgi:hypothetical protein